MDFNSFCVNIYSISLIKNVFYCGTSFALCNAFLIIELKYIMKAQLKVVAVTGSTFRPSLAEYKSMYG